MRYCFLLSLILLGSFCFAQLPAGNWDKANKVAAKGRDAVVKKGGSFKRWKQHLQDWGTDTSYTRGSGILGRLHSDGWAVGIYAVRKLEDDRKLLGLHLSFSEIIHEKQTKQERKAKNFPQLGNGVPYMFGKIANLYTLNLMLTQDRPLLPGVLEGSVSVGWRWGAGLSIAFLKPYYLSLIYVDNSSQEPTANVQDESFSNANANLFLDPSFILGSGKWADGLSGLKAIPGITGEIAITVAPTRAKTFVPTLALGVAGGLYTQKLPIMAEQPSYRWQIRLFASLQLGKRW